MSQHSSTDTPVAARTHRTTVWCVALIIVAFCLSLLSTPALAVNARIKGKVVDQDGTAVKDVAVTLTGSRIKGKPLTGTTNKKGAFTFIVETGSFEILLEKDGYIPQIIKLDAKESGIEQVKIVLEAIEPTPAAASDGSTLAGGLGSLTGEAADQLEQGLKALDGGDAQGALATFEQLSLTAPDKEEPLFYMGMARAELGSHQEAVDAFTRALAINPDLGQAQFNLGRSLIELDDHDGAAAAFDKAIAGGAMDAAHCHQLVANIYIARGDHARTAHYLEQYCLVKPGEAEILFRLGSAWFNEGDMEKSVAALEQAIAADPKMAGAHYQLGMVYLNQGLNDQAVAAFNRVVEVAPGSPLAAEASGILGALQ